jgi:carbon storage regulator CsrA
MLALERRVGERIRIGADIWVKVVRIQGDGRVVLGIDAPRSVPVVRDDARAPHQGHGDARQRPESL